MALDEPKEGDESHDLDGLHFVIAAADRDSVLGGRGVRVDRIETGMGGFFHVSQLGRFGGCG
jgi:hypothetical protein